MLLVKTMKMNHSDLRFMMSGVAFHDGASCFSRYLHTAALLHRIRGAVSFNGGACKKGQESTGLVPRPGG